MTIQDVAEHEIVLMPTPTVKDHAASGGSTPANVTLTDAVVRTELGTRDNPRHLPTPRASRGGSNTETAYALGGERSDDGRTQGEVSLGAVDWGPYRAAIERAERVLGRPAPSPVRHDGRNGKARLNPELPEWMMSWEPGWVTDPAIWEGSGLSDNGIRNAELKAIGNGVATLQAVLALRHLLTRNGVPSVHK